MTLQSKHLKASPMATKPSDSPAKGKVSVEKLLVVLFGLLAAAVLALGYVSYSSAHQWLSTSVKDTQHQSQVVREDDYIDSPVVSILTTNEAFYSLSVLVAVLLITTYSTMRYNLGRRSKALDQLKVAEDKVNRALAKEVELSRMKANFVTLASHEFRTPLTTILSSSFLIENYVAGPERARVVKHLAKIKTSVNNLTSILDEFLSVNRIEEGKIRTVTEWFNVKEHVENFCHDLQSMAKAGQRILYIHEGAEEAKTDPVMLGHMVKNLLTNSIKYSSEHSNIEVNVSIGDTIQLRVKDQGIGIPAEDQPHLFERFFRASNASAVQGTGLGLHIVKCYVDMLKGTIEVKSVLGAGTEVKVVLPNEDKR